MSITSIWVEPDRHDGWIVKRDDPEEIYHYEDRGSAELFARALAHRCRPCAVAARLRDGRVAKAWIQTVVSSRAAAEAAASGKTGMESRAHSAGEMTRAHAMSAASF